MGSSRVSGRKAEYVNVGAVRRVNTPQTYISSDFFYFLSEIENKVIKTPSESEGTGDTRGETRREIVFRDAFESKAVRKQYG